MRRRIIVSSAALAVALGAVAASAAALEGPTRKSGYWRMDIQMSAPKPSKISVLLCTDPAVDKTQSPFGVNTTPTACPDRQVARTGDGWTIKAVCNVAHMQVATTGVATGDFSSRYHVDITTRMTPPPMPSLAELKTVVDGVYLGPCPAGKKPGDVQMTMNGNVMNGPAGPHVGP